MATGAAWCGAGALGPARPRHDGGSQRKGRADGGRRVDGMALGSVQVTARRKPSSPPCPCQLSDSLAHSGLFHPYSPRTLSLTCMPGGRGDHSAPVSLVCNTRALHGDQASCAQLSWTEVGPLAASQGGCGSDGLKIGPPRGITPVTPLHLPRGWALLTALQTPKAASSSSSGERSCAHLPAEVSVPPGLSQGPSMFHTEGQTRDLMVQNLGSGSWPRRISCFVPISAALREETQASPSHPPEAHSAWFWPQVTPGHSCLLSSLTPVPHSSVGVTSPQFTFRVRHGSLCRKMRMCSHTLTNSNCTVTVLHTVPGASEVPVRLLTEYL